MASNWIKELKRDLQSGPQSKKHQLRDYHELPKPTPARDAEARIAEHERAVKRHQKIANSILTEIVRQSIKREVVTSWAGVVQ